MIKTRITAETNLSEILNQPKAVEILTRHKLPCLTCPLAAYEIGRLPLGLVAEKYNLPLEEILKELNEGL